MNSKGIYTYEYTDNYNKRNETQLLEQNSFIHPLIIQIGAMKTTQQL